MRRYTCDGLCVCTSVGVPIGLSCVLICLPWLPHVCEHSAHGDQSESVQLTGQSTMQLSDSLHLLIRPNCWKQEQSFEEGWLITYTNKRKDTFPYFKQAVVHFRTVTMKQLKKYHELWFQMLLSYNCMFFEFYERESHCRCTLHINRGGNITAFIHIKLPLLSGVIWFWIYQRWSAGCWYQFARHHCCYWIYSNFQDHHISLLWLSQVNKRKLCLAWWQTA